MSETMIVRQREQVAYLEAVDLPDFHERYRALEEKRRVDSAGGQEWRRLLSECVRSWMVRSVDPLSVEAIEEVLWYVQKTQWTSDSAALETGRRALDAGSPK